MLLRLNISQLLHQVDKVLHISHVFVIREHGVTLTTHSLSLPELKVQGSHHGRSHHTTFNAFLSFLDFIICLHGRVSNHLIASDATHGLLVIFVPAAELDSLISDTTLIHI